MPNPKVLVVEDNVLVSHAVCDMLTESGYETEVEYSREVIKKKINIFLGYEFINKIKLLRE